MPRLLHVLLRCLGWLFLVAVVGAAGAGVYLYRRFSPDDARRLAAEQLTALLRREVTIERLVLSPRGVKVVGLRVRRAGAGEGDLLACGSALATVDLSGLLARRLQFDSVVLQSPQISLTRDAEGRWELADVFGSSSAARAPRREVLPLALAAAETVVQDGVLRVDDRLRGRRFSLERLSLRVDSFHADRPFPVEARFASAGLLGGGGEVEVEASGRVDMAGLRLSSASATVDRLVVRAGRLELAGRAEVRGFSGAPRLELEASAPAAGPEDWRALLGRDLPLSLPASRWSVAAGFPAPGMVDLESATVRTPAGAFSATGVFDFAASAPSLSVDVAADDADLSLIASWWPPFARRRLAGRMTARASLTGWPGRLQPSEADVSLKGFAMEWDGRRLEGVNARLSAADELSRLSAEVSGGRFEAAGNVFEEIAGSAKADGKRIEVERLTLRWGGSRARLRGRVGLSRVKGQPARLNEVLLSADVDRVDWDTAARLAAEVRAAISTRTAAAPEEGRPWLKAFKYSIPREFPDTTGRFRVGEVTHANFFCKDVELLWSLRGVTPSLDRVGGEARLSFGPGRVADIPAVQGSNTFLRVVFLPFVYMHKMNSLSAFSGSTAYPKTLDFSKIDGEYGASKGLVTIRYFHVDSPQLVAYAEGSADLGNEKVDMNILTRLTSYRGALPEWWVDEAGRPAIGFRVKGDINKPEPEPRFQKIGEKEIEGRVEEGRARAQRRFETLSRLAK